MKQQPFDLVIIGAGIIGASVAWYARQQYPGWKIALIDKSLPGSGATYFSATLDFPYGHTPLRQSLTERSRKLYEGMMKDIPGLPLYTLPFYGFINAGSGEKLLKQFTDNNARLSPEGMDAVISNMPGLNIPRENTLISGVHARYAYSREFTPMLIKETIRKGNCFVLEGSRVEKIKKYEGMFEIRLSDNSIQAAKRVVLCTGPWIPDQLFDEAIAAPTVRIKKIVAFHIYQQPRESDPVLYFFDDEAFLLPRHESGYWLMSYRCDQWDVSPSNGQLTIDENDKRMVGTILDKYWPSMKQYCQGGRVFCDAYTGNGDPVIANIDNTTNLIVATAGSGSGFRLAPGIAEQTLSLLQ